MWSLTTSCCFPGPASPSPSAASPTTWPPLVPVQLSPVPPDSGGPGARGAGSTHTCPAPVPAGKCHTGRGGAWSNAPSSAPEAGRSGKGHTWSSDWVTGPQSRCQGPRGQPTRLGKVRGSHMLSLSALDLEMTSQTHTRRPTRIAWVWGGQDGGGVTLNGDTPRRQQESGATGHA